MATLNISIPDSMREWIDAQVEAGGYANASDYIRDLVRHNQRERESIQLTLIEGERSGVSERSVSDIARQAKRRCNVRRYELSRAADRDLDEIYMYTFR